MARVSVIVPVLVEHEWQHHMTVCALNTMRCTTRVPFELVIVQAEGISYRNYADKFIEVPVRTGRLAHEINLGFSAASCEYLVHAGNDIFPRPGWLEAMLECFAIADCGAATVLTSDMVGSVQRPSHPEQRIGEGVYGPLMMFKKPWLFDENNYKAQFCDTDLIMRMYKAGLRSYRNYDGFAVHLLRQTVESEANRQEFLQARQVFIELHKDSPTLMYKILSEGIVI